ncbi:DUF4136 domain-containing protein [Moheibacter lacus]|uniref:DUF4136 domain-containing protein n=1 Tax=Moheibacter lacus TaxID=2745851 RepID=A0A838ZS59_9FLAO|nr:DUF4136 domain-containing protein [Moheibacter lacus]MBA5629723.1 DUF4136 domain-containing protein [Moheibacter lacus]
MKSYTLFMMLVTAILMTSCNTVRVSYDFDRSTDFNAYKTYNFHQNGIDKLELNDLDKRRILAAIDVQMAAKGFTKSDNPQLYINVLASSKEKINIDNGGYYGGWGPYWGGPSRVYQYTSGTIILDIVDNARNILIWQGSGSGLDVSNLNTKSDDIPRAIEEILAKFPPPAK